MALALGITLAVVPPASASGGTDSVTVTQALVNRLGGVSVEGTITCAGSADQVRAGTFEAEDESGAWVTIPWTAGDRLLMVTNPDQYTVTQPAGRKRSVQVTHTSSRATPCYTELTTFSDGTPIPCEVEQVCTWRTDAFGYDQSQGPWFDYSASGRFSKGWLNVTGHSSGLYIAVVHSDSSTDWYSSEDALYLPYNAVVRATARR